MLVFSGLTLAQYNTYTEETKLRTDAKKLIDVLELAKKKALSADLQDKDCTDFTGYKVRITPPSTYSLLFCCSVNCSSIQTFYLADKNTIITGAIDYNFLPLMANLKFNVADILLNNSIINKSIKVTISPIGIISLDETLL